MFARAPSALLHPLARRFGTLSATRARLAVAAAAPVARPNPSPTPAPRHGLLRHQQLARPRSPQLPLPAFCTPLPVHRTLSSAAPSMAKFTDPTTLSNFHSVVTEFTTVDIELDFKGSKLSGTAKLLFKAVEDAVDKIVLDTSYLDVKAVTADGKKAEWKVGERVNPYGEPLTITLPAKLSKEKTVEIVVEYATTKKCTAIQWMTPEQTGNKKHPYMFSQCQAINARSCYPCQDTPAVKSKFEMRIRSPLPVVASGLPTGSHDFRDGTLAYTFSQPIPIPSYLFAVASGDIASAAIGPRSTIYAGPEELLKCKAELEESTEKFIEIAEKLIYPYAWTKYDLLILPSSFPYGGMENPNITFATPTIISGDKSNIDVIAHELAHSWSGNLVSTASWEHFWLNEGWTTYIERRIQGALHGAAHFDFSAIIGWKALAESVKLYGDDHEFTKMVQNLKGEDPEDAFSSIPYEKGFTFLYHLDKTVGRAKWDKFIPHYFKTYHEKSLTSFDFKDTLLGFFEDDSEASAALAKVDWDSWFYAPGLPPKPDFDTSLADVCYSLADKWNALDSSESSFTPSPSDIADFAADQQVVFLERITDRETPLKPTTVATMREAYPFLHSHNAEVLSRFLTVGLKSKYDGVYEKTTEMLGIWGRMKYTRPLFRLLNECDRELALKTFEKVKSGYHPITRSTVGKDLGVKD